MKAIKRALAWPGRRRRRVHQPHGLVLMYHRIAAVVTDPWHLAVQPKHFESQVSSLREHADVVPLATLHERLRPGRRSRPVVAVTFDDGYLDNLAVAKPVLERHEVPATVFVATGYVGKEEGFWWDRLAQLLLAAEALPANLALDLGSSDFHWSDGALMALDIRGHRARRRLHDALWRWLCGLVEAERESALDRLAAWAGRLSSGDPTGRPMRPEELRQLISGGLVDIGAHSVSHPMLTRLSSHEKAREIRDSRAHCAQLTGTNPAALAFPGGNFDMECLTLAREAGFRIACTSQQELVWAGSDVYQTPRVSVPDVTGESLLRRLRLEWLP